MRYDDISHRLQAWLVTQLPEASDLRVEGIDRVNFGYSAELLLLTVVWRAGHVDQRHDVVVRFRPTAPSLIEPCKLRRQFDILKALEPTPVHAPRALWIEESGEVLGRPFYVMERLPGKVYESDVPAELSNSPELITRMAEQIIDELASIHRVDIEATGLAAISDGRDYLDREIDHWASEMHRVQLGPLPALERLLAELIDRRPRTDSSITLVHGDAKPGNFAFVGDQLTGVFDWEMASVGDPLTDVGWAEVTWPATPAFAALSRGKLEELLTRYSALTGYELHDRAWYRSFQTFKMTVIMLIGGMLFDSEATTDRRMALMGLRVPKTTKQALAEFGIDDPVEDGPVAPRNAPADMLP